MKGSRKIRTYVSSKVVTDSGDVLSEKENYVISIPSEPNFVKLYIDAVMYISDMPTGVSGVMQCILKRLPYADAEEQGIMINKYTRTKIAEELGMSEDYVRKSITALVKGKILIHDDTTPRSCNYKVNPYIFGRGDWKDIEKLRLHVEFNAKGKTFWGEVLKAPPKKYIDEILKHSSFDEVVDTMFANRKNANDENQNAEQSEAEQNS